MNVIAAIYANGYKILNKKYHNKYEFYTQRSAEVTFLSHASRIKGKDMFTEKNLIAKMRGVNFANNPKNTFQKECYCKGNAEYHQKDTFFDAARRTNLAETYFGAPNDKNNHLLRHTKLADEATLMKTYNTVSQNIAALHTIGQRNWSAADISIQKNISQVNMGKPRTAQVQEAERAYKGYPAEGMNGRSASMADRILKTAPNAAYASRLVRVFSPQQSCYIETPAHLENESQKLTYLSMKSANNINSVKVCGGKSLMAAGKPFEWALERAQNSKPYTVSAETFQASWVDRGRPQTTTNYESAKFNVINHTSGANATISKLINQNPKACYKVKSIAEYCDLARVSAIKPNKEYQEKLGGNPACFMKSTSLCAKQCDFAKTYGPFFKLFNK